MKFFALFIYRPVATILISRHYALRRSGFPAVAGAPLPQVDFPVIMVSASCRGLAGNHGLVGCDRWSVRSGVSPGSTK
jgi:multidrug efflux pump subunit AcrB